MYSKATAAVWWPIQFSLFILDLESQVRKLQFFHTFSVILKLSNYRKCMGKSRLSKNWSRTSLHSRFCVLFLWTRKLLFSKRKHRIYEFRKKYRTLNSNKNLRISRHLALITHDARLVPSRYLSFFWVERRLGIRLRRARAFWLGRKTQKFSGTNQKWERRRPFGTGLIRHCPQGLFSPFFTFLRAIFSRPFRLSLAPTICPWVSEDGTPLLVC